MGIKNRPAELQFGLVDGNSQLIIGLDANEYADTCNRQLPKYGNFSTAT